MVEQVRKDFLVNVKFSDSAVAWALQAQGFYYSAQATLNGNTIIHGKKMIAQHEAYLFNFCDKTICYLLSHSIELGLKAIYCAHNIENVEHFSHKIHRLIDELTAKKILQENEFDKDIIKIASVLLDWQGRYHKPKKKKIPETIDKLYTQSESDPNMLENKYKINSDTHKKLFDIAKKILAKTPVPAGHIGHLIF